MPPGVMRFRDPAHGMSDASDAGLRRIHKRLPENWKTRRFIKVLMIVSDMAKSVSSSGARTGFPPALTAAATRRVYPPPPTSQGHCSERRTLIFQILGFWNLQCFFCKQIWTLQPKFAPKLPSPLFRSQCSFRMQNMERAHLEFCRTYFWVSLFLGFCR